MRYAILLAILWTPSRAQDSRAQDENEIVQAYLRAVDTQRSALRGSRMEAAIQARLPKLGKSGTLRVSRRISCSGRIVYQTLESSGDPGVKRDVIARYLNLDSEEHNADSIAITPANYEFHLKTVLGTPGVRIPVFQLKPRRKQPGLFKGELWVDLDTGMPVYEAGQFVRSPSIFLKRVRFERDYEEWNGITVPKRIDSVVETRIVGRAEITIEFSEFSQEGCMPNAPSIGGRDE